MTPLKFAQKIRKDTKQSTTSLTDADILLLANPIKDDIAELIATYDIKGNYLIVPATDILIANQREYAFPDELLDHIFSLEIAFSGTTDSFGQLSYVKAFPDDFRRHGLSRTEMNIQSRYSNARPCYEIQRRSLYLLSGAIDATTLGASTIADAIRLRSRVYPSDLTQLTDDTTDMSIDPSTTTFGMPRQFHELWARACSIEWKGQNPGAVPISAKESTYQTDLMEKLNGIQQNDLSGETLGRIPRNTGENL